MIRTLNYTGRKKLPKSCLEVSLFKDGDGMISFESEVRLDNTGLPEDARVFIEAYKGASFMRFDCGTIGKPIRPKSARLDQIQSELVTFRLKIVEEKRDAPGKILGIVPSTSVQLPDSTKIHRMSLLHVEMRQLEHQIWLLDLEAAFPTLLVNDMGERHNVREIVRNNAMFRGLVFPTVVREVFRYCFDNPPDDLDKDDWRNLWFRFALENLGMSSIPEIAAEEGHQSPDALEWIEEVVSRFGKKFSLMKEFTRFLDALEREQ